MFIELHQILVISLVLPLILLNTRVLEEIVSAGRLLYLDAHITSLFSLKAEVENYEIEQQNLHFKFYLRNNTGLSRVSMY